MKTSALTSPTIWVALLSSRLCAAAYDNDDRIAADHGFYARVQEISMSIGSFFGAFSDTFPYFIRPVFDIASCRCPNSIFNVLGKRFSGFFLDFEVVLGPLLASKSEAGAKC